MQPPQPSDFLYLMEGEDITEEQALEYLSALIAVLQDFVDLGFEINSVHRVLPHNMLSSAFAGPKYGRL